MQSRPLTQNHADRRQPLCAGICMGRRGRVCNLVAAYCRGKDIIKAFTRRSFLAIRNLVNFFGKVRTAANSRCLVDMYIHDLQAACECCPVVSCIHILREALRLLVPLYRALPEPLIAERATSMALTLFCLMLFYPFGASD